MGTDEPLRPGASNPDDAHLYEDYDTQRRRRREELGPGLAPQEADRILDERDRQDDLYEALRPQPGDTLQDRMAKARARASVGTSSLVYRRLYCQQCGRGIDFSGPEDQMPDRPTCPDGRHRKDRR